MKERIRKWYNLGLWTDAMVRTAAAKSVITEAEAAEIIGQAPMIDHNDDL